MPVTSTARLTHSHVHARQGHSTREAIGIVPRDTSTSVHNGREASGRSACAYAACHVPMLRAWTALAEEQRLWWAATYTALVLDMRLATEQACAQSPHWLHPLDVIEWHARFLAILDEGDRTHPQATVPPGHRGRVTHRAARHLLNRVCTGQHAGWALPARPAGAIGQQPG